MLFDERIFICIFYSSSKLSFAFYQTYLIFHLTSSSYIFLLIHLLDTFCVTYYLSFLRLLGVFLHPVFYNFLHNSGLLTPVFVSVLKMSNTCISVLFQWLFCYALCWGIMIGFFHILIFRLYYHFEDFAYIVLAYHLDFIPIVFHFIISIAKQGTLFTYITAITIYKVILVTI